MWCYKYLILFTVVIIAVLLRILRVIFQFLVSFKCITEYKKKKEHLTLKNIIFFKFCTTQLCNFEISLTKWYKFTSV